MKSFKFIHAADLHLDSPFIGLTDVPTQLREALLQSSFHAFTRLIDMAIDEAVSFIVISGDLFDAEQRSLKAQLFLHQQLERLKPIGIDVFIIHGNHDPLSRKQTVFQHSEHVHVFQSDSVTMQPAYHHGELVAYIYGTSYRDKAVFDNLAKQYFKEQDETFHIALYHGSVGTSHEHEPYAPCTLQDLLVHHFDYVALGHIHKPQLLSESPPVVYPGNIQGRHRKESGERGCYLVEVNGQKQTRLTFVPLALIQWETVDIDCSAIDDEQQLIQAVLHTIYQECGKQTQSYMVVLRFHGATPLHHQLNQQDKQCDLLEALRSFFPITEDWIYISKLMVETSINANVEELLEQEPFLQQLVENARVLTQHSSESLLQQGAMKELWQHYELSRLLPQRQEDMLQGTIEEALQSIFDHVAQEKGRDQ